MPYGDTESNYHRLGELTLNYQSLRAELLEFQQEITDLKSSLKYIRTDIEKLVAKQAETDNEMRLRSNISIEMRLMRVEATFGDLFHLDREKLKERREKLLNLLSDPISDLLKASTRTDLFRLERLLEVTK